MRCWLFPDATNAYRFGPPKHDVIVVRMKIRYGRDPRRGFPFPAGMDLPAHGGRREGRSATGATTVRSK